VKLLKRRNLLMNGFAATPVLSRTADIVEMYRNTEASVRLPNVEWGKILLQINVNVSFQRRKQEHEM
jgi:hypothetical protein